MSAVNNLLDKYREACSLTSDSAVADRLKISRQGVHQWRKGLSWPSEDHVIAMAKAIDEPAERWFVEINADRASPAGRKIWLRLIQAAASIAAVYVFSRIDVHHEAVASIVLAARNPGSLYIMSIVAASMIAVGMALAWKRSPRMEQRTWHATSR